MSTGILWRLESLVAIASVCLSVEHPFPTQRSKMRRMASVKEGSVLKVSGRLMEEARRGRKVPSEQLSECSSRSNTVDADYHVELGPKLNSICFICSTFARVL